MDTPLKKISTQIFELGEKKRQVEVETNKATSIYETESKKAAEATDLVTSLHTKISELTDVSEQINNLGTDSVKEANDAVAASIVVLRSMGNIADAILLAVAKADGVITQRIEDLNKAKADFATKNEEQVKEGERLQVLKKDLDIYRNRLQIRYNELGLGDLIL
jgi:hypothetical protein